MKDNEGIQLRQSFASNIDLFVTMSLCCWFGECWVSHLGSHASELVFLLLRMNFCICSHAEFGYFLVKGIVTSCSTCTLRLLCTSLPTIQHSMDVHAFEYLKKGRKPSPILKKNCQTCHHNVEDGTNVESFLHC